LQCDFIVIPSEPIANRKNFGWLSARRVRAKRDRVPGAVTANGNDKAREQAERYPTEAQ
jgi:hypothetical protein